MRKFEQLLQCTIKLKRSTIWPFGGAMDYLRSNRTVLFLVIILTLDQMFLCDK